MKILGHLKGENVMVMKKVVVVVVVFTLLLIVFIFLKISFEPFGTYSNKKRSACVLYEGKIIGFDFSKAQLFQGEGRSYIPLYIKLNKKYRKENPNDYKNFISMVIEHFESRSNVKVTSWQMDNSASLYDFLTGYEGRINGLWVKHKDY